MSAGGFENDEDHKPKTFELIEVFLEGENKYDYDPIGILYRDPRVDKNGGFVAERGYIVDFKSTSQADKITLMTNIATEAKIEREGPNKYVCDKEHDVYCYTLNINCEKKPPNGRGRNNHTRRKRGRRGGGGAGGAGGGGEGGEGGSFNSDHT